AKGFLADHPFNVGVSGGFASEAALSLLPKADCVVAVGSSIHQQTTKRGTIFSKAKIIHIDRDAAQIGRVNAVNLGILGDARASLAELNGELNKRGVEGRVGYWTDEVRSTIAASREDNAAR